MHISNIVALVIVLVIIIVAFISLVIYHRLSECSQQLSATRLRLLLELLSETCQTVESKLPKNTATPYSEVRHAISIVQFLYTTAGTKMCDIIADTDGSSADMLLSGAFLSNMKTEQLMVSQLEASLAIVVKEYPTELAMATVELKDMGCLLRRIEQQIAELRFMSVKNKGLMT